VNGRIIALAALTELGLRTLPLGLLCRGYGIRIGRERGHASAPLLQLTASELATVRKVERVYRLAAPGQGMCLRRALVCGALLRKRAPVLRLGATRVDGKVQAHAWLELERAAASGKAVRVERESAIFSSLGSVEGARAGAGAAS
jgi:hypothetical protein